MRVILKQLRPELGDATPLRGSEGAAGYDVRYVGAAPLEVLPYETVKVPLGIALEVPPGFYTLVTSRSSSLPKHGLHVVEGKIDSDYRGEIFAVVHHLDPVVRGIARIEPMERVAQIIFKRHEVAEFIEEAFTPSLRGVAGFGSTGVR